MEQQIKEFEEVQVAGVIFHDFMTKLKPYVDQGWMYNVESVQHMLPSTFVVTMTKQQEQATKPARKQQQQKVVDKQD